MEWLQVEWSGEEWSGNGSSQQQTDDLMRTADFCRAKHLIVSQRAHSARSLARNGVEGGDGGRVQGEGLVLISS